jgi:hypothetical protein
LIYAGTAGGHLALRKGEFAAQCVAAACADRSKRVPGRGAEAIRRREQLYTLELALDHRFLGRMSIRSLAGAAS